MTNGPFLAGFLIAVGLITMKKFSMSHRVMWSIAHVIVALSFMSLHVGCPSSSNVDTSSEALKPRREMPLRQTMPPQKKRLMGIFVDATSTAISPDGRSWDTAFNNLNDAVVAAKGETIYVAAGTYKNPRLDLRDRSNVRLMGGYKKGDVFEKEDFETAADAWAVLDGEGNAEPLITITGDAHNISLLGGFVFKNVVGGSAVVVEGARADRPIKNVIIAGVQFQDNDNNAPAGSGGGVRVRFAADVRLKDIDATNNLATLNGGFVSITDVKNVDISQGTWERNVAGQMGGALYVDNAEKMKINGAQVKSNQAREGGGIYASRSHDESVSDMVFEGNQAVVGGGAVYVQGSHGFSLTKARFVGNKATGPIGTGGALRFSGGDRPKLRLGDETIADNEAYLGGAFFFSGANDVSCDGGKFLANQAAQTGGSLYFISVAGLELLNAVIDGDNKEANSGGAVLLFQPGEKIKLRNIVVKNAKARNMGGGLYLWGAHGTAATPTVTIEDSRFQSNAAGVGGNGGAIATRDISYPVIINNTLFRENRSENYGGALALDGLHANARFVIGEGTEFIENSAGRDFGGGAILAVFDKNQAVLPLPREEDRRLVFYTSTNVATNKAGIMGVAGQFLRVTGHKVTHIPPVAPDRNPKARPGTFLKPLGGPGSPKRLSYYIAYSTTGTVASWNRLRLDWEQVSSSQRVYSW